MNLKKNKIIKAKEVMINENLTLCLYDGDNYIKSTKRGVAPLLDLIDSKKDYSSYVSSDKVIGKGAAFLYVILNIKNIYCLIISEPALEIFNKYGIDVEFDKKVPFIINRTNDGYCPIEKAVLDIECPKEALNKIRDFLEVA